MEKVATRMPKYLQKYNKYIHMHEYINKSIIKKQVQSRKKEKGKILLFIRIYECFLAQGYKPNNNIEGFNKFLRISQIQVVSVLKNLKNTKKRTKRSIFLNEFHNKDDLWKVYVEELKDSWNEMSRISEMMTLEKPQS